VVIGLYVRNCLLTVGPVEEELPLSGQLKSTLVQLEIASDVYEREGDALLKVQTNLTLIHNRFPITKKKPNDLKFQFQSHFYFL
jgi:hypothetical protein